MVKNLAEKHGLRATFMPKPFNNLTGNGCHAHVSVWGKGKNQFLDKKDRLGLSKMAYNFLGGVIKNAQPLSAFFNPTINSYRRINAPPTKSGATWSPSSISYTGNNRTHMIRIPDPGRFELRLMDGSANPYLLQAGVLAAGLEGINKKINPGKPLFCNMYTDYKKYPNLPKLPNNVSEALNMLRIEAGLIFAGYEFNDQIDPFEAGIGFTVPLKSKKSDFIGRSALEKRKMNPQKKLVGLDIKGGLVPNSGDCIRIGRAQVGEITSATKSPYLDRTIALARIVIEHSELGTELEIGQLDGHQKRIPAKIVRFPHFDPEKLRVRGNYN